MDEQTKNQPTSEWEMFVTESGKIAIEMGRTLGKAAEDITGLIVVRTDKAQRDQLDMLVKSGATRTRAEGLKMLTDAGVKAREAMFKRIEATQAQIETLKQGLKGLVGNG